MTNSNQTLFLDANVFVESFFDHSKDAVALMTLAANGKISIYTSEDVLEEVVDAIKSKVPLQPLQKELLQAWSQFRKEIKLKVLSSPAGSDVANIYKRYLPVMRHEADIPVLTAALSMKPLPNAIVSGNREHFNDKVSERAGVPIYSCKEFLKTLI